LGAALGRGCLPLKNQNTLNTPCHVLRVRWDKKHDRKMCRRAGEGVVCDGNGLDDCTPLNAGAFGNLRGCMRTSQRARGKQALRVKE